jgi:hypothetical protein
MLEFLSWLEGSALGQGLRDSGVWTYGVLNLAHIAGISVLFGTVVLLDLRLLGFWRAIPLDAIARPTVPLAVAGFVLAAASGVCMITVNASEYHGNPFLLIKFPAIALALINTAVFATLPAWREKAKRELSDAERNQLRAAGGISLLCWMTAVAAGRMIGYW